MAHQAPKYPPQELIENYSALTIGMLRIWDRADEFAIEGDWEKMNELRVRVQKYLNILKAAELECSETYPDLDLLRNLMEI